MNTVIILAAGQGSRMNADINKQYLDLGGRPILAHTLQIFDESPVIDEIIMVIHRDEEELLTQRILNPYGYRKIFKIVHGGNERQESVRNGLMEVSDHTRIVLIHDGARPFITKDLIRRCVEGTEAFGAISVGVPMKETIKIITEEQFVDYTPERNNVWITQTPQAFKTEIIKKAHELAIDEKLVGTDDAMLVEKMGIRVKMVEGDYTNLKITTPEDLIAAKALLTHKIKSSSIVSQEETND